MPLPKQRLYHLEVFKRENAADAAAVERQDALWSGAWVEMLFFGERQWRLP